MYCTCVLTNVAIHNMQFMVKWSLFIAYSATYTECLRIAYNVCALQVTPYRPCLL